MRKIKITDTTLRDAHQSLMATRMKTDEMFPILDKMNQVGYYSMEVWGGATFDSCMRFLDEDPWERLVKIKDRLKDTKLQMLLRGQNLVGYRHYPDDAVEEFVKKAVANGIEIIRIFDALNDIRNMEKAIEVTKNEGAHAQGTISYTISPVHDLAHFVEFASRLKEKGVDSICIKDMAGLISPWDAYELVSNLKKEVGLPVQLHCHYTSGMASMSYLKGIEAGADVVDTAAAPLSMGTSQPATDSMVAALQGTPYDTGIEIDNLAEVSNYFKGVRNNYHIPGDISVGVDTNVLNYQIPGGMISNLRSQLAEQNSSHLIEEVLEEVPRVRAELGYPPLVTPSSQIVGTQAVVNVLMGERYKMVSTEVKNYLKGLYGTPPGDIDEDLRQQVLKGEKPITGRPADVLEPILNEARAEIEKYMEKEEDILSYVLFPNEAIKFFKRRIGEEPPLEVKNENNQGKSEQNMGKNGKESMKESFENINVIDESLIGSAWNNVIYYPA